METKICTKCNRKLNIDNFSKNKSKKSGYNSWCKDCIRNLHKPKEKENIPEGFKYCGKCGKLKSITDFNKSSDYGYQSYCKECKKQYYSNSKNYTTTENNVIKCIKCNEFKNVSEFSINIKNTNGHNNICRSCKSNYDRSRTFDVMTTGSKYCPRCNKHLSITEFSIAKGNPTGRAYSCKSCQHNFEQEIIDKVCIYCGKQFKDKRKADNICVDCKKHSKPEWEFIQILKASNIIFNLEYNLENKYWYDFYLPEYNLLVDINPTESHSSVGVAYFRIKDSNYHYNRVQLANKNGYKCICIWDWEDKETIVQAIKNDILKIDKLCIRKHWSKGKEHKLDNNFNEQQMIKEGWLPIYDDGQELICF